MTKRAIIAVVAVFIAWSVLDFLIHGLLLQSIYAATASLWRPMDEMIITAWPLPGSLPAGIDLHSVLHMTQVISFPSALR